MKNIIVKTVLLTMLFSSIAGTVSARECTTCKKTTVKKAAVQAKVAECKRAQSTSELNVNNVRALINGYGNMWYDGSIAQYHIPKDGTSTPLFCAALWIGGTDVNEQLRIAALRFGSSGDDYWPGPLTIDGTANVTKEVCNAFDHHYKISQKEVSDFRAMFTEEGGRLVHNEDYDESKIAQVIKDWPAHGTFDNQSRYLAPFKDVNGDGVYDYRDGDYPYYDFNNSLCPRTLRDSLRGTGLPYTPTPTMEDSAGIVSGGLLSDQVLKGDQTIWWVFNDMGNTHTESGGQPIGLEIRAQAFAFSTNDEINNMTFYSYEIINRSTYELRNTYFSQWVDPDLGYAGDDFVGCDVKRGLGYCYNGDESDGPGTGSYTGIPPAVGIDFFQGPYMDADGLDNPKIDIDKMRLYYPQSLTDYELVDAEGNIKYDTISLTADAELFYPLGWYFKAGDSVGNCAINGVNFGNGIPDDERFGMRRFVYYENGSGNNGEPSKATDYYNYLQGIWRNGKHMKYGGNALDNDVSDPDCDFMFPGNSDPLHWGTDGFVPEKNPNDWTELTASDKVVPGDRRFMQSAGPFTLKPGALNYITVGIPFAQATSGNAWQSVEMLREIDDICQALFENCFKVLDGPDAPTLVVQELDREVILYITYENPSSNNAREHYDEEDPTIPREYMDDTIKRRYTDDQRRYKFEGYQIYQMVDANASVADLNDVTKARLVAQCDIENYYDDTATNPTLPIGTLVNYTTNQATGMLTGNIMVEGENKGIKHVFRVTTDLFASGVNANLVNNKKYYYLAVAYAHNRYKEYSQTDITKYDGQREPYLAGRKNEKGGPIESVMAMPHDPASENGGTKIQATFGMSPNITRIEGYGNGGTMLKITDESIQSLMGAPGEPAQKPGTFTERTVEGTYSAYMTNPCIIANPVYEQNAGPINVRIIDPLNVKPGEFYISFDGSSDSARWVITKKDGTPLYDSVYSDTSDFIIGRYNEQLFLDLGISVGITNPKAIADPLVVTGANVLGGFIENGGLLGSGATFADINKSWYESIPDNDSYVIYNWIRSGSQYAYTHVSSFKTETTPMTGNESYLDEDYFKVYEDEMGRSATKPIDKFQTFEECVYGTWAPYGLVSTQPYHPAFSFRYYLTDESVYDSLKALYPRDFKYTHNRLLRYTLSHLTNKSLMFNDLSKLPSVRVVITSDTSKWTRCPVLEMCDDYTQAEGRAHRFQLRKHASIDKNGDTATVSGGENDPSSPNYISARGMGWFPGYAINLETGERLNMMYGEDSRYVQYNGRDMMWNPVQTIQSGTQNYVMGGRHYIYVMNAITQRFPRFHQESDNIRVTTYRTPSYDAGRWSAKMLRSLDRLLTLKDGKNYNQGLLKEDGSPAVLPTRDSAAFLFSTVAWVNMPLVDASFRFNNPKDIPTDVTIDLYVNRQYGDCYSDNGTDPSQLTTPLAVVNNNHPMYMFQMTDDIVTLTGLATSNNARREYQDSIMGMINVVPNPYYSNSAYETTNNLETVVRFINVPGNTTISIYTVDGTLVRKFEPTPALTTSYDWDLLNHNGLPIAGGMYLIHFSSPGIGERVVKWFGTMRPVDLSNKRF